MLQLVYLGGLREVIGKYIPQLCFSAHWDYLVSQLRKKARDFWKLFLLSFHFLSITF